MENLEKADKNIEVIGWIAFGVSVCAIGSIFDQIFKNIDGQVCSVPMAFMLFLNASLWLLYFIKSNIRKKKILIIQSFAIITHAINTITALF